MKTHHYKDATLVRYFNAIKNEFSRAESYAESAACINNRTKYWFKEENIKDLARLDQAIRRETPAHSPYRSFFLCGFSNILKPTSLWLTKSIKPQRDPQKSPREVMRAFEDQFALMRHANSKHQFPTPKPQVRIQTRNFLTSKKPDRQIDLIVTSPPYVTSYDYADIHQLSALWLRYTSDHRTLRKNMLGNRHGTEPPDTAEIKSLGTAAEATYYNLLGKDRCKAHSVARYFLDMHKAVAKCWRILKDGGMVVFVIGNTQYKQVKIDNAKHLEGCMKRAGFIRVETAQRKVSLKNMTPYRDALGRFTKDSTQRRVYSEEFVIIGRK